MATTRGPDGLANYLREIRHEPLLTAAEERALAAAAAAGGAAARARMIRANLRLVVCIARPYLGRGLTIDDLVGEGNLGLIKAVARYDTSVGVRFSTYAGYWIRQTILYALVNTTATVRLPAYLVALLSKWRRASRALAGGCGRAPTPDQVDAALGLTAEQAVAVRNARGLWGRRGDGPSRRDGEAVTFLAGDGGVATVEYADDCAHLSRLLGRVDDHARDVLAFRYGLGGEPPGSVRATALRFGVSRHVVRKVEREALARMAAAGRPRF